MERSNESNTPVVRPLAPLLTHPYSKLHVFLIINYSSSDLIRQLDFHSLRFQVPSWEVFGVCFRTLSTIFSEVSGSMGIRFTGFCIFPAQGIQLIFATKLHGWRISQRLMTPEAFCMFLWFIHWPFQEPKLEVPTIYIRPIF